MVVLVGLSEEKLPLSACSLYLASRLNEAEYRVSGTDGWERDSRQDYLI